MTHRQILAKIIKQVGTYYGRQLEPEVLTMMVDDLEDLSPDKVVQAFNSYRRDPKNRTFPLPAQIRAIVNPENHIPPELLARESAARICAAVPKFGWNNSESAAEYIGIEGWDLVQRQGGWTYICENLGTTINPSTFQAQCRDQLIGSFAYGSKAIEERLKLPTEKSNEGKLEHIGSFKKLLGGA